MDNQGPDGQFLGCVQRLGLNGVSKCWLSKVNPKIGSKGWVQRFCPKVGSQEWVLWFGPKNGFHGWVPKMGPMNLKIRYQG